MILWVKLLFGKDKFYPRFLKVHYLILSKRYSNKMSFEEYNDFGKATRDLFDEDFDTNMSLTIKGQAPKGVSVTSTTDCCAGAAVFPSKLNLQWAHADSGFSVDKLELSSCSKASLETSLAKIPYAPGLQLNFKGEDSSTGSLGMVYKHKLATLSSEIDIAGFNSMNVAALGGASGVTAGATASLALGNKFEVKDFGGVLGYSPKDGVFVGVKTASKCREINGSLQFQVQPKLALAALVDFTPKTSEVGFTIGTSYQCCPGTSTKVKVNNDGFISASVKTELPNNLSVVGAATVDIKNPAQYSFGLNATLG
jgi:hypothetical protein